LSQEDLTKQLEQLQRLLAEDPALVARLVAQVTGSGAVAQAGGVAAGERGVGVGGDVVDSVVVTGDGNVAINVGELRLTLSPEEVRSLVPYTPPSLPDPDTLPDVGPPGWRMPFHRNALFTGRTEPLKRLARALLHDGATSTLVTQAVAGMGGVGKTQLAVEFAHRYGRFFHGVHWLNGAQPGALGA